MIMVNNQIEYTSRRKEYFVIFDFWTHAITDEEVRGKVNEMFAEWEKWIRLIIQEAYRRAISIRRMLSLFRTT